ncbi:MAG: TetR/AcrR family transcriptional regulator [Limnobacter sp.]|nr:TetR/AcrR family transcriptional regulator [Limnobacter sp.]
MPNDTTTLHGRQRLINAALALSFQKRSFSSLGIREITREAKLSPPAFYRHFGDLSDLGTAVIGEVEKAVIQAFSEVRRSTEGESDLDIRPLIIRRFFDWAAANPREVVVGASEAFGALPKMREGLKSTIQRVAEEICSDPRISGLLPDLPPEHLNEVIFSIAQNVFFHAVEYVEHPSDRDAIFERVLRLVDIMFTGAHALQALQDGNS